jgi:hypothetical protein
VAVGARVDDSHHLTGWQWHGVADVARAHQIFGLRTLGQLNLGYFLLFKIRTARGTHQGARRAVGVTERWRTMAPDLSQSSAASAVSSKGWKLSGSDKKGAVRRSQARRGVTEVQNAIERRRSERGGS